VRAKGADAEAAVIRWIVSLFRVERRSDYVSDECRRHWVRVDGRQGWTEAPYYHTPPEVKRIRREEARRARGLRLVAR
jgi:hypothetical protein